VLGSNPLYVSVDLIAPFALLYPPATTSVIDPTIPSAASSVHCGSNASAGSNTIS